MSAENRLKFGPFLTIYNKDYVKKQIKPKRRYTTEQEFKDPVCEGFKNFLVLEKDDVKPPLEEDVDGYLETVKHGKPKIGKIYFEKPLDHIAVKGGQLLNGKSVYQVDYCDIEAEIKRKLRESETRRLELPEGWEIPLTTQKYDFRDPSILSKHALDPPMMIKQPNNLGQNEKINEILEVRTGDSEYNQVIGKLGEFIVNEQMHGKIVHPKCTCLLHNNKRT